MTTQSNNRKQVIWLITGLCGLILALAVVWFLGRGAAPTKQPVIETESPGTVVIENTDQLSAVLLSEQYTAVVNELTAYIQSKVSKKVDHALIVGDVKKASDGTIVFNVKTDKVVRQFSVVVDRNSYWDKVIFKVPQSKFTDTLQIY